MGLYEQSFCRNIITKAELENRRSGEQLMKTLPKQAAMSIVGTSFDPFYATLSYEDMLSWVERHLKFEDNEVVAIVDRKIYWEAS